MPLDLDRLERRIIGVLVEKQMTVPDTYPLSVNALVSGCNQKSNRDPQMSVEDYEVEGALRSLMDKSWVREMDIAGGRTLRYEHHAEEQLGVDEKDLAILTELLIRGPQTPGELKTRASRMTPFGSPGDIEARLRALADRPVPYVEQLARRTREHAARWQHLLGGEVPEVLDTPAADPEVPAVPAPTPVAAPASAPTPRPVSTERATPVIPNDRAVLLERVEMLEMEVRDLNDRLDRLEGR